MNKEEVRRALQKYLLSGATVEIRDHEHQVLATGKVIFVSSEATTIEWQIPRASKARKSFALDEVETITPVGHVRLWDESNE